MREYRHPQINEVQLGSVLYALSDPIRLAIVRQLAREGEATCAALENGHPKSSVSHHFRVLREAGIIKTRNDGTSRINELRTTELAEVFPGLLPAILAVPA